MYWKRQPGEFSNLKKLLINNTPKPPDTAKASAKYKITLPYGQLRAKSDARIKIVAA